MAAAVRRAEHGDGPCEQVVGERPAELRHVLAGPEVGGARTAVARGARLVQPDGDDELDVGGVGDLRTFGGARGGHRSAAEERGRTERGQTTLGERRDRPRDLVLRGAVGRDGAGDLGAVRRVDEDASTEQVGPGGPAQLRALARHRGGRGMVLAVQAGQLLERLRPEDAVDDQPDLRLEADQCLLRLGSEHAVDESCVEAEPRQPQLQVADVLAPQHRAGPEQQAVAEPVGGGDEHLPRLEVDDPVGGQAVTLLEPADRSLRRGAEHAALVSAVGTRFGGREQPDAAQQPLDVLDVRASAVDGDGVHGPQPTRRARAARSRRGTVRRARAFKRSGDQRKEARSASSCALPFAPTMRLASWPPWMTSSVGIDMIP